MRILMIGKNDLKTDAIEKILSTKGYHLKRVSMDEVEIISRQSQDSESEFDLSIVDLNSSQITQLQHITRQIKEWKLSRNVLGFYDSTQKQNTYERIAPYVDAYISLDSSTEEFIESVKQLGKQKA